MSPEYIQNQNVDTDVPLLVFIFNNPKGILRVSYPQKSGPLKVTDSLIGDTVMFLLSYKLWFLPGQEKESPTQQG